MAYRFTNTDKWSDAWFCELKPLEKLLFNYLCDNCDIAGFIELTERKFAFEIGCDSRGMQGALKGLTRGLIYSELGDCIYIRNFLKHQKNLPLNEKNKAHLGIIKRFELYSNKFNINNINEFIQGASKGLPSPIGIGNGIGIGLGEGNGSDKDDIFNFKNSLLNLGIEKNIISDYLKIRAKKKAVNSETAFNSIKSQIEKAGLSANDCIKKAVEKSWSGFEASWLDDDRSKKELPFDQDIKSMNYSQDPKSILNGKGD